MTEAWNSSDKGVAPCSPFRPSSCSPPPTTIWRTPQFHGAAGCPRPILLTSGPRLGGGGLPQPWKMFTSTPGPCALDAGDGSQKCPQTRPNVPRGHDHPSPPSETSVTESSVTTVTVNSLLPTPKSRKTKSSNSKTENEPPKHTAGLTSLFSTVLKEKLPESSRAKSQPPFQRFLKWPIPRPGLQGRPSSGRRIRTQQQLLQANQEFF